MRWILLFLFVGHVVHLSLHLATDAHHDLWHAEARQPAAVQALVHPEDPQHDHDCHPPHSSTDHLIQRPHKSLHGHLNVDLLLPGSDLVLAHLTHCICSIPDVMAPAPGLSPPDPRQPRAPPLA